MNKSTKTHRRSVAALVIGTLFGIGATTVVARFGSAAIQDTVSNTTGLSTPQVSAAIEFCALGAGDGASLFDVGGWTKAARRVHENDWDLVLKAIQQRCPEWRDQIVGKSDGL